MLALYPSIEPNAVHHLPVDNLHTIYVEECGNKEGVPVLFIHGGPGAGCDVDHRRYFDPKRYRIILFDQRGTGHSTPHAELKDNTTPNLVSDMEKIRHHLGVDRWVLFGGSWGSTLALIYAETHPDRVLNMVLRGIFLCREEEYDWFYKPGGASRVFPEAWNDFVNHLSVAEQKDIMKSYYLRLTHQDEAVRVAAAKEWSMWEAKCASLRPSPKVFEYLTNAHTAVSLSRIETHYFINHIFMPENYILENVHRIKDIPGTIVHGRYDMCCPVDNAYLLNKAWPKSKLVIIEDAGHTSGEPGVMDALIAATNAFVSKTQSI